MEPAHVAGAIFDSALSIARLQGLAHVNVHVFVCACAKADRTSVRVCTRERRALCVRTAEDE